MAHSSAQNSVSERSNKTFFECVRALLNDAALPLNLWAELASTITYTKNLLPSARHSNRTETPHQVWWNKCPDVSHLRAFGLTTYAKIQDADRENKLLPKSIKCRLIGYQGRNGYRLYIPSSCKII